MKKLLYDISFVITACFVARLIFFFYFSDTAIENEWRILFHNLSETGTLGINIIKDNIVSPGLAKAGEKVLPSAFMPPLYVFYIYLINILSLGKIELVKLIIFTQIILSCFSTFIFFKILRNFLNKNSSIILTYIFSFYPLNILASLQTSSITLQLFLFLFFIFYFINLTKLQSYKNSCMLGVVAGLLMLMRGEFGLFFILSNLYLFFIFKINYKNFLICILFSLLVISPYLKRNYINFDHFILVKSFGFNLLKGNNSRSTAEGNQEIFSTLKLNIEKNNRYEVNRDNLYKSEAIKFIKNDPSKYLKLYFIKIFTFIFLDFNSTYPNYYNILHIVPKIVLSTFTIFGVALLIKKKGILQYLTLFYMTSSCFFSIFFILPRYSLIVLPIQIILSFYGFEYLKNRLKILIN